MLHVETRKQTVLIFYNTNGNSGDLEDLVKVEADVKICLGNLVGSFYANPNCMKKFKEERYERAEFLDCLEIAKDHNIRLLKGQNEINCKYFPDEKVVAYLQSLPIRIDRDPMTFLPSLIVTEEEKEHISKLEGERNTALLKSEELAKCHGQWIAENLFKLQKESPATEVFFAGGRREAVFWEKGFSFSAQPNALYDKIKDEPGSLSLDMSKKPPGCLIFPGCVQEGYFCIISLPERKLTLYSV